MRTEDVSGCQVEVGLLQNEVEVRGRQIDALLSKLDSTADRIVELTVEIKSLNSQKIGRWMMTSGRTQTS